MKKQFKFEINEKTALDRHKYCRCGSHVFNLIHQLEPTETFDWWVECPECGCESIHAANRRTALWAWRNEFYDGELELNI